MRKIDEMGLGENTCVIYMSDNGAGGRRGVNEVISGGKGTIWEGGIRVPLIVRGPQWAIYAGDHKLVRLYEQEQPKSFHLKNDMAERNDLAAKNPELATRLDAKLAAYLKKVGAGLPVKNEDHDPKVKVEPKRGMRGGGGPGGGRRLGR